MSNIQSLRGMKDILQEESKLFTYFIENASRIAKNYGYSYIETPILEETALFKRSVGDSSDIVNKEMYQFIDKGQNDVCLRPEGTAGVVRSFIQNKFDKAGGAYKFYYHGPMFRYERPQKGRLRQFHQFAVESFGEQSIYEDANIIALVKDLLDFFQIKYTLLLNSLGCSTCMPQYRSKLLDFLSGIKDELCSDCNTRVQTNPIRVLDCKTESCKKLLENAPKITKNLCPKCHKDFEDLKNILDTNNISYKIEPSLVRGLDYYTQTAFEFVSDEIGAQSTITGGGRYDKLVEYLGGKATPAIGFAMGIQRLLELIKPKEVGENFYYLGALDEHCKDLLFKLFLKSVKKQKSHMEYETRSFNKHFKIAEKLGASHIVLLGENELKAQTISIKNLQTKEERKIEIKDF